MSITKLGVLTTALACIAIATAISAAPSEARAAADDAPNCTRLGCAGGNQLCATYEVQVGIPGAGSVTVTYYCYQAET